jgi:hypothetical protein
MKKLGLLLVMCAALAAYAQQPDSNPSAASTDSETPGGTLLTNATFPTERVQTPTTADLYCAGFVSKTILPKANFIAGGLETPSSTKFVNGDVVYLQGGGYQTGQQYTIVREVVDHNRYEMFPGQFGILKEMGQPYGEIARVRIVDTRSKLAIGQVEFSCDPVNPGDLAVPFVDKTQISFHPSVRFDRFAPPSGKLGGRIVMSRDFDYLLGPGAKIYMNAGSNQGVKVGDYFRAVRTYESDLHDPVDSLWFKAAIAEDTQKNPPSMNPTMFTKNSGPTIHVQDLPRRAVGEIVILSTTPTTSTGMVVFAMEELHLGDGVEIDQQAQQ